MAGRHHRPRRRGSLESGGHHSADRAYPHPAGPVLGTSLPRSPLDATSEPDFHQRPATSRDAASQHLAALPQCATWVWTDGSATGGVTNGGAGALIEWPDGDEHMYSQSALSSLRDGPGVQSSRWASTTGGHSEDCQRVLRPEGSQIVLRPVSAFTLRSRR